MHKNPSKIWYLPLILFLAALIAAVTARWTPGSFGLSFRLAAGITLPFVCLSVLAWHRGGKAWVLALMMLLAFSLRLGFGLATVHLLPEYGHPNERREELGFLFDDAYRRNEEALAIASEDIGFKEILTRKYNNDQYGALAVMNVCLYKYFSPDARRFTLIMLIGAFFTAIGLPFLWKGLEERWDHRVVLIGCWIYALYPDSVFFSGAPMREPFLTGILAAAFWALSTLVRRKGRSALALLLCLIACLPFSSLIAAALLGISLLWIWAEILIPRSKVWLWSGAILAFIGIIGAIIFALPAFKEWIHFDIHTTELTSGWVEKAVGEIGGQFRALFVAVYGLTQPVLPAILVYPVAPACDLNVGPCTTIFWKVAGIYRASGWYILVPFLFYSIFSVFRIKDKKERTLMIVNAVFVLVWMFISSLRAGGDQYDNPRYRIIFMPWLAFMAAWGIDFALKKRDWWLVRWIAIELIFLGFFTQWYVSRYYRDIIRRFPFWKTVIYIVLCSAAVFATGLIGPIRRRLQKRKD